MLPEAGPAVRGQQDVCVEHGGEQGGRAGCPHPASYAGQPVPGAESADKVRRWNYEIDKWIYRERER